MSINVAAGSFATGVGLTVYGGYKYLSASQKAVDEISKQKKIGLGMMAAGVTAIAVAVGLIYSGTKLPENPVIPPSFPINNEDASTPVIPLSNPVINEVASRIEGVSNCSINALKEILVNGGGNSSITAKTFGVLANTQGISCDNYLPWQTEFHKGGTGYIDGIQATHLPKPAMWGIDVMKRPFLAIKYVCDQTQEGAVALFQRYTDGASPVVMGGSPSKCLDPLDPIGKPRTKFLENLFSLLMGKNLTSPNWDGTVSVLTIPNTIQPLGLPHQ